MPQRKKGKKRAAIVHLFANRLRELRLSCGLSQAELARQAGVTEAYLSRLESALSSPGIDLVDRLAGVLGVTAADLLPAAAPPDTLAVLQEQARRLFESLLRTADRETLMVLNPLLARMVEASARGN